MKRLLSFLGLMCLILSPVWANSPSITSAAVSAHTDLSMSYLAMLFGTVGHSLNSVSGQMLGKLFYKFNEGLFCAAGVMVAYTSFSSIVRGSGEGKIASQKSPAHFVIMRVVLGMVLIMPSAATGYNLSQDIMMRVVVSGVKLADMTWSYGLQYLNQGGSIFSDPSAVTNSEGGDLDAFIQNAVFKKASDSSSASATGIISQVFSSEVCMFQNNISSKSLATTESNGGQSYNSGYNDGVLRPILSGDLYTFGSKSCGQLNYAKLTKGQGNITAPSTCQVNATVKGSSPGSSSISSIICPSNFQAAQAIVTDLLPVARDYACNQSSVSADNQPAYCQDSANLTSDDIQQRASQAMFSAMVAYMNALRPIQAASIKSLSDAKDAFIPQAKADGWASAGNYYWSLEGLQDQANSAAKMSTFVNGSAMISVGKPSSPNLETFNSFLDNVVNGDSEDSKSVSVKSLYTNFTNTNSKGGHKSVAWLNDVSGVAIDFLLKIIGPIGVIFATVVRLAAVMAAGPTTNDPVLFLRTIGNMMASAAGDVFVGGIMLSMAIGVSNIFPCKIGMPFKDAVDWVRPVLFFTAMTFLGQAFLYCYYVPLYPYLVYSFAVMGWLAVVIEAMIAAALIAIGVTYPEGHDFLGRAEQALMLAVSVFVRPVLLVIGYFAGMILSYVALRYVIYTFSHIAWSSNNFTGIDIPGMLISMLVVVPIYYSLFAYIIYQVITQSYNMIFSLPDYVMRWIGVSQQTSFFNPEKMANAIQSSYTQGLQKSNQLGQQAIQYHANKQASNNASLILDNNK